MASRPSSGRERCLPSRGETQRHTYQVAINNCSQRAAFSVMTLTFCSFLSVLRVPVWVSDGQFAGTRTDPIFSPHILGNQSDKGIKKCKIKAALLWEKERETGQRQSCEHKGFSRARVWAGSGAGSPSPQTSQLHICLLLQQYPKPSFFLLLTLLLAMKRTLLPCQGSPVQIILFLW